MSAKGGTSYPGSHPGSVGLGGGDGTGTIDDVTSADGSIVVSNPTGPTVNLAVNASAGLTGIDTSAMPGPGTFAWLAPGNIAMPTDALVARSCNVFAVFVGGKLINALPGLPIAAVKFTTAGGKPANGSVAYLASAFDDGATGAGKLTATRPLAGTPYTASSGVAAWPENPVRAFFVTDNSLYDSAKTCAGYLLPINTPENQGEQSPPADKGQQGYSMGGFTAARYMSADGNQSQLSMNVGESFVLLYWVPDITAVTGFEQIICNLDATYSNGWVITVPAGQPTFRQANAGAFSDAGVNVVSRQGLNCFVITIVDDGANGQGRVCLNGSKIGVGAITNPIVPPTAGYGFDWGNQPSNPIFAFASGEILAWYKLAGNLTDTEMQAASSNVTPAVPTNRFEVPAFVRNSGLLQCSFEAQSWPGNQPPGVVGGPWPGSSDFTMTVNSDGGGGPIKIGHAETWYRNLARRFIDSEPHFLDANSFPRGDPGATLEFVLPAENQDFCVGVQCDDRDNGDNADFVVFVDGSFLTVIQPITTGLVQYYWLAAPQGPAASHTVTIYCGDKLQRYPTNGLLKSGGCFVELVAGLDPAFTPATTANRLIVVGDDNTHGHDTGMMENSVTKLLRDDYPGRVTAHSATDRALGMMFSIGGGSVVPFAREIIETAKEGNAAAVTILITLGWNDYDFLAATQTPAQYGTRYGALLDALHAAQPTWGLFAMNLLQPAFDAIANAGGFTLSQYRTQVAALTTGRPWLTVFDGRTPNVVTYAPLANPNIQVDQTGGTAALKANIKLGLGY